MDSDKINQSSSVKDADNSSMIKESPLITKFKSLLSMQTPLGAWLSGLFFVVLVILPPFFLSLITFRAGEISKNPAVVGLLEIFLFVGASYLLLSKRGTHDFRLIAEITVWVVTANILLFKYIAAPLSYLLVAIVVLISFVVAYKRSKP